MNDEDYILKVDHLNKKYGDKIVLKDLSFNVKKGEIFGLIGSNGTGKSTTIKCLTNIVNYDSGDIIINGFSLDKSPIDAKKSFGLIMEEPCVYEDMSGKEFVSFTASIYGVNKETFETRYEELVSKFDMKNDMNKLIKFYSHGMKQKVAMIASLIHEPKLWILDEPLTGLDIITVKELIDYMKDYREKGNSIFLTSHNIDIVEKICDRVVFIHKGKILNTYDLHSDLKKGFSLSDEFFKLVKENSDD